MTSAKHYKHFRLFNDDCSESSFTAFFIEIGDTFFEEIIEKNNHCGSKLVVNVPEPFGYDYGHNKYSWSILDTILLKT